VREGASSSADTPRNVGVSGRLREYLILGKGHKRRAFFTPPWNSQAKGDSVISIAARWVGKTSLLPAEGEDWGGKKETSIAEAISSKKGRTY